MNVFTDESKAFQPVSSQLVSSGHEQYTASSQKLQLMQSIHCWFRLDLLKLKAGVPNSDSV